MCVCGVDGVWENCTCTPYIYNSTHANNPSTFARPQQPNPSTYLIKIQSIQTHTRHQHAEGVVDRVAHPHTAAIAGLRGGVGGVVAPERVLKAVDAELDEGEEAEEA